MTNTQSRPNAPTLGELYKTPEFEHICNEILAADQNRRTHDHADELKRHLYARTGFAWPSVYAKKLTKANDDHANAVTKVAQLKSGTVDHGIAAGIATTLAAAAHLAFLEYHNQTDRFCAVVASRIATGDIINTRDGDTPAEIAESIDYTVTNMTGSGSIALVSTYNGARVPLQRDQIAKFLKVYGAYVTRPTRLEDDLAGLFERHGLEVFAENVHDERGLSWRVLKVARPDRPAHGATVLTADGLEFFDLDFFANFTPIASANFTPIASAK